MKSGEIAVCINAAPSASDGIPSLTEGKQYVILERAYKRGRLYIGHVYIAIRNDAGAYIQYRANRFKTLEKIREDKLKELGI